jgi:outer membrane receptor for ferrienterochelin and colicin
MKKQLRNSFAVLIAITASLPAVFGQDDSVRLNALTLRELLDVKVTTASKTLQSSDLASAVVKVITREQIRSRGYQSLLDVLYDLPDIKVDDKMYSGMRNSVTLRGAQGSEKMLILLDGVSIATPSGEAMPIMQNYPVHLAEQIEILYGPASALYGANAVSGIINIITRKNPKKKLTAEISSTAGMYRYTNSTLFLSRKWSQNTVLTVSGQYYYDRQPDYTRIYKGDSLFDPTPLQTGTFNSIYGPATPVTPVTPRYEAPMEAYNVYVALHSGKFTFNVFRNYFKLPTALENNTNNGVYNKSVYMAQTISMANASYKKSWNSLTSSTSLTVSDYELLPKSNYRNLYTGMEPGYKYSNCTMIRGEEQIDYLVSKKLSMIGGIGFEHYDAVPQSGDLDKPVDQNINIQGVYLGTPAYYNPEGLKAQFYFITYNNIGAYYQLQYSPSTKVNITAGARYDRNSRYGSSFNPRMGIVLQPLKATTVKLLFGTAFRAPSPSDSYSHYGSFATSDSGRSYHSYFLHLANPGLKPIKSMNAELNISHRFSDNFVLSVDGYYTALRDLYTAADDNLTTKLYNNMFNGVPVDYIEVFVNRKKQVNYGGSMELNWKHNIGPVSLRTSASVSYVNGIIKGGTNEYNVYTKDMEIDFVSPWMGRIGTDMKLGKFTCSPRLLFVGRQRVPGISDTTGTTIRRQTLPGYALLNISMAYQIHKSISFSITGTNVLDQRYKNVSFGMDLEAQQTILYRGQPQDPIRIMAGLHLALN